MTRPVVLHIHLFKNAGTSVERALAGVFGERWLSWDGDLPRHLIGADELAAFLAAHPTLSAISSHQVRPPLPDIDGVELLPVVFLRHPIDRIRSAYDFERTQRASTPSSLAAASLPMDGWIDFHRRRKSAQVSNFQVRALTEIRNRRNRPKHRVAVEEHLRSAIGFLDRQRSVGLVERYPESLAAFERQLQERFPELALAVGHVNTTASSSSLDERLDEVRDRLGPEGFDRLIEENEEDFELYDWAVRRFTENGSDTTR
jgi:hypothetical protein